MTRETLSFILAKYDCDVRVSTIVVILPKRTALAGVTIPRARGHEVRHVAVVVRCFSLGGPSGVARGEYRKKAKNK